MERILIIDQVTKLYVKSFAVSPVGIIHIEKVESVNDGMTLLNAEFALSVMNLLNCKLLSSKGKHDSIKYVLVYFK